MYVRTHTHSGGASKDDDVWSRTFRWLCCCCFAARRALTLRGVRLHRLVQRDVLNAHLLDAARRQQLVCKQTAHKSMTSLVPNARASSINTCSLSANTGHKRDVISSVQMSSAALQTDRASVTSLVLRQLLPGNLSTCISIVDQKVLNKHACTHEKYDVFRVGN